LLEEGP